MAPATFCSHAHIRFFERDVNGVREHFRRRFGYEAAGYPSFDDLERDDDLDIEVSCSGFTKEMEKDLLQEYGMEEISEDEEDSDADDADGGSDAASVHNDEQLLTQMREQVEAEVQFAEQRADERNPAKAISFNIQNYISSMAQHADAEIEIYADALDESQSEGRLASADDSAGLNGTVDSISELHISKVSPDFDGNVSSDGDDEADVSDAAADGGDVSSNGGDDGDTLTELDPTSRQYRLKMVERMLEQARSHRSYSTSASTIAPSVVSERIKRTLNVKEKREQRKKCVAKGEASAVTRARNENRDTVKQYAGWDF